MTYASTFSNLAVQMDTVLAYQHIAVLGQCNTCTGRKLDPRRWSRACKHLKLNHDRAD